MCRRLQDATHLWINLTLQFNGSLNVSPARRKLCSGYTNMHSVQTLLREAAWDFSFQHTTELLPVRVSPVWRHSLPHKLVLFISRRHVQHLWNAACCVLPECSMWCFLCSFGCPLAVFSLHCKYVNFGSLFSQIMKVEVESRVRIKPCYFPSKCQNRDHLLW